jgi:probable HAF family extracellular repeat protein
MTDLGSLSGGHSFARGVNATDQVVGDSSVPAGAHAFLWKEGAMSDLGTLGGPFSAAYGINDIGHVVGYALTQSFAQRAVVWRGSTIHDLNDLIPADSGWELREARAINTAGQIVGTGILGGENRAFLLTPAGDVTPPLLVVPAEMTANATSPNGAVVLYAASATDDIDGTVPVTCAPPSGSTFPIGTTTVTCTATDAAGNTGSASFTVHVKGASEQVSDLIAVVDSYNLRLLGAALHDKLVRVQAFLVANKPKRACERLDSFLAQVKEQRGKRLPVEQADRLTADARRIKAVIGC